MNYKIYSIKDTLANCFAEPHVFSNDDLAVRWFKACCDKVAYYADFQLFCLGDYDNVQGVIIPETRFVCEGKRSDINV